MSSSPKKTKKKPNGKPKTQTKWSVTQKLEVIDLRDSGARWIKIAQDKGMSESTVRTIYAQRDEIQARGKAKTLF